MERQKRRFPTAGSAMLSAFLFAFSAAAQATPQEFIGQEIREIGTGGSAEGIYIITTNTERSLDGCGSGFFLEAANPLLNQNLAIALSALYARSRVQIQVDGCQGAVLGQEEGQRAMRMKNIRVLR